MVPLTFNFFAKSILALNPQKTTSQPSLSGVPLFPWLENIVLQKVRPNHYHRNQKCFIMRTISIHDSLYAPDSRYTPINSTFQVLKNYFLAYNDPEVIRRQRSVLNSPQFLLFSIQICLIVSGIYFRVRNRAVFPKKCVFSVNKWLDLDLGAPQVQGKIQIFEPNFIFC